MATRSEPYLASHVVQQALASDVLPTNSSRSDMHQPLPVPQSVYEASLTWQLQEVLSGNEGAFAPSTGELTDVEPPILHPFT